MWTVENFVKWANETQFNTEEERKFSSIVLPTGTGKMYCMTICIAETPSSKILFASHRKEIIKQAEATLADVVKGRKVSVEMKDRKGDPNSDIVLGSVASLARNRKHMEGFIPDYIYIDEGHHFSEKNKQYQGLIDKYPNARIILATATPFRTSGEELPLGTRLIEMDIGTAVKNNYLVIPKPRVLHSKTSLANVKTQAGDFEIGQLSKTINNDERNKLIVDNALELIASGRKGVIFAASVEHSKSLCSMLSPHCVAAEIYGDTDDDERDLIMEKMRNGEVDVLLNNLVATEGTDIPIVSFIIMARPTKSLGLYLQCIGRGLRKYLNKIDCIIVDVWDKIKTTQTRITFADMADAGDLYGDDKRCEEIIKTAPETVANQLVHFPVIMKKEGNDFLSSDDETWAIVSYSLAPGQWIISWSKEVEKARPSTDKEVFEPLFGPPHSSDLVDDSYIVKHNEFGIGIAKSVKKENNIYYLSVDFNGEVKDVLIKDLLKREVMQELSNEPAEKVRVSRLYYLCFPDENKDGRLIHFVRKGSNLFIKQDFVGSKNDFNALLIEQAEMDDVHTLMRSNAAWRKQPASPKQIGLIANYIKWNKAPSDLDLKTITKGDAGFIIDRVSWMDIINKYFTTSKRENLIGHNSMMDDV